MPPDPFSTNWETRGPERRRAARFEIVGGLSGAMTFATEVRVCNLSRCGALVVAPGPLAVDSRCTLRVHADSPLELEASVRRVEPSPTFDYHIGLEFVTVDDPRLEEVFRRATASGT